MRKILKYFIGVLFCCSLLVTVIPFAEIENTQIALLDLFRWYTTNTVNFSSDFALNIVKEVFSPFVVLCAVLVITVFITAVYAVVTRWKNAYIISFFGALIINVELGFIIWKICDMFSAVEENMLFEIMTEQIELRIWPIVIWALIYIFIIIGSIWGILQIIICGFRSRKSRTAEERYDEKYTEDVECGFETYNAVEDEAEEDIMTEIVGMSSMEQNRRCPYCGNKLESDAVFCGKCGHKI